MQKSWSQMREEAEKTGGFSPHPVGTFRFRVIEASMKKGANGQPQILARIENIEPGSPYIGKTTVTTLSPEKNDGDVNSMFFQQVGAMGIHKDHPLWAQLDAIGDAEQGLALIATEILNAEIMAEITHRTWDNEIRDNVKRIKPVAAGSAPTPAAAPAVPAAAGAQPPAQTAVPTAPAPAPVAPSPQAPAPVAPSPAQQAPAPVVAPTPAVQPVAPQPSPAPVPQATEATLPQAVAPAPVPAQEATPAPQTEEAVVAQIPSPPSAPF